MRIALITKPGHEDTGVGRYAQELKQAQEALGCQVTVVYPVTPLPVWLTQWVKRLFSLDLVAFFNNYPIWVRYPEADVYHLTSQNLATLMLFHRPPGKTVITVHDIIPWLLRDDPALRVYRHPVEAFFDRLALRGIRRADGWLADSNFTAQTLAAATNIPVPQIKTVMLAVS